MPRLQRQHYQDIERIIEFDFVRATEAAALNSVRWLGRGDKEAADAAACDAMRGMFDLMNICGEVVIGEGIKDEDLAAEAEKIEATELSAEESRAAIAAAIASRYTLPSERATGHEEAKD